MKITVKILLGKECTVEILPSDTVLQLKHKVSDLLGVEVPRQKLLLTGKALSDDNPISFYPGIKEGSRLNLVIAKPSQPDGSPKSKSGTRIFKDELLRVLIRYYTHSEAESIANEIIKELKKKVNHLSFDDLERLATALLQDQELTQRV